MLCGAPGPCSWRIFPEPCLRQALWMTSLLCARPRRRLHWTTHQATSRVQATRQSMATGMQRAMKITCGRWRSAALPCRRSGVGKVRRDGAPLRLAGLRWAFLRVARVRVSVDTAAFCCSVWTRGTCTSKCWYFGVLLSCLYTCHEYEYVLVIGCCSVPHAPGCGSAASCNGA